MRVLPQICQARRLLAIRLSRMLREPLDHLFPSTRTLPQPGEPHAFARLVFTKAVEIAGELEEIQCLSLEQMLS